MKTLYKTDAQLQEDVQAELNRDWRFKPAEIGVEVDAGVVTLTGTVSSYTKLIAAGEVAAQIAGAKGVANDLTVRTPGTTITSDTQIVEAVRNALLWNADVPEEKIDVIVRNGAVTLKGKVDYWYQRKAAADTAGHVTGVITVSDQIEIVPPKLADLDIKADIRKALMRRMPYAADAIHVEVAHGVVTLTGEVRSYSDRVQAANAVWAATGVKNVVNQLKATW